MTKRLFVSATRRETGTGCLTIIEEGGKVVAVHDIATHGEAVRLMDELWQIVKGWKHDKD